MTAAAGVIVLPGHTSDLFIKSSTKRCTALVGTVPNVSVSTPLPGEPCSDSVTVVMPAIPKSGSWSIPVSIYYVPSFIIGVAPESASSLPALLFATLALALKLRSSQTCSGLSQNVKFQFYSFLDAQNCHAFLGDLEERYRHIHKTVGKRRADFWYWTQAIRSLGPIAWAATKKMMKSTTGLAALVELYRKVRS
jgi:hypothetical protein